MPHWVEKAVRGFRLLRRCFGRWLGAALLLAWLAPACSPAPAGAPAPVSLRVAASDLAGPLLADLAQGYAPARPGVQVMAAPAEPATMEADLAAGRVDLALTTATMPGQFTTPLGYVFLLVVVNPANTVSQLSAAQVADIFAGRTGDWAQVGGAPGAIQVVCREDAAEGAEAFGRLALDNTPPTLNALVAPSWAAMHAAVSQDPMAIGYLPAPEVAPGVRAINLERPLRALIAAVAPEAPAGAARDFVAWVQSADGQAVVAQRYAAFK